jgi:hypothetical protein
MATACALRPRKPEAKQPAGQIPMKLVFNMMPDRLAALVAFGKPALQVPGYSVSVKGINMNMAIPSDC